MAKIELDKYYTSKEVAKRCIDKTFEVIGREKVTEIIEPSAGDGAFSLQIENCIAYDIEPHHESIERQDFLDLKMEYQKGRLFIGNPPFGTNTLSVKFFKHCIKFGDYIAFILPISQLNNTDQLFEFDIIYSEDLGELPYSDRLVHCCFNIYKRPLNGLNKKPNYDLRNIKLTEYRRKERENIPIKFDTAICSYGSVGEEILYKDQYCKSLYISIDREDLKEDIINFIKTVDWRKEFKMTKSPSLTKSMFLKTIKKYFPTLE